MPATMTPPTAKQLAFIARLEAERPEFATSTKPLTSKEASIIIDALLKIPAKPAADAPAEPGMYRTSDGKIYKVQRAKESGNLYAKVLVQISGTRLSETDERVQWEFQYAQGAIRTLKASDRLSLEDAKKFGIQFGVCCVCGALLKDATSVENGIGPVCATRIERGF